MNDFEEIALSGGKIEFLKRNGGVSARYSHSANCKSALYEIGWVPDGDNIVIVGTWVSAESINDLKRRRQDEGQLGSYRTVKDSSDGCVQNVRRTFEQQDWAECVHIVSMKLIPSGFRLQTK